jgi:DNA-binding NarL/FixJ family response regulator
MTKARILLADDHEIIRHGLANLIDAQPDMLVVGQASNGLEALQQARSLTPDLIVMDVNMPVSDGLEATRQIRRDLPNVRILMLTVRDEDEILLNAIRAGAHGYLLKGIDSAGFLRGVRSVLDGEAVLPPKLAARLLEEFMRLSSQVQAAAPTVAEHDLTNRELDVLRRIAEGASDKEISAGLSISLNTVKSHVRSILHKLHAINRRQAAKWAERSGLLDD